MTKDDDAALVRRAGAGDLEAFADAVQARSERPSRLAGSDHQLGDEL